MTRGAWWGGDISVFFSDGLRDGAMVSGSWQAVYHLVDGLIFFKA